MRPLLIALPLIMLAHPAFAAPRTAQVSGTPSMHTGPGSDYPSTGPVPAGAVVTLERCTTDKTKPYPGMPQPRLNDGDWCLIRGAGWIDASTLTHWSAPDHPIFPADAPAALIDGPAPSWFDTPE